MIRFTTYQTLEQSAQISILFLRQFSLPAFLLILIVYLSFHAVQGERGLIGLGHLVQSKIAHQTELANISAENDELKQKIQLLSGAPPDKDFLEERVRIVLGFAYPDEDILILDIDAKTPNFRNGP